MFPGHCESNDLPVSNKINTACGESHLGRLAEKEGGSEILPPVRGLVVGYNDVGAGFPLTELKKWVRLSKNVFAVEKIDFLADTLSIQNLRPLLEFAHTEKTLLSLRTGQLSLIDEFASQACHGLHDVFLCPDTLDSTAMTAWFSVCEEEGIPVRVELCPPESGLPDPGILAEQLKKAVSVNVAPRPSFNRTRIRTHRKDGHEVIRWMNTLTNSLSEQGVETHLIGLPFCYIDDVNYPSAVNGSQFFLHHQHYMKCAYELAERIFSCSPNRMAMLLENMLSRRSSLSNFVDNALFPWILGHPKAYARTWMLHKIRRHIPRWRRPLPLPESPREWETALKGLRADQEKSIGRECVHCGFRRICDHETPLFASSFPGLGVQARPGSEIVDPLYFARQRAGRYDVVDERRRHLPSYLDLLADSTREITAGRTPSREIPVDAYEIENHYNPIDDASKRWLSLSKGELVSTVLGRLELPVTMMLTFGGGIAEQIGFSFGRGVRIVCPMVDYSHKLVLHVDANGYYVLLRDGIRVRPTEFDGAPKLPARLSTTLEPRICIQNIDGFILTQTLLLWEGASAPARTRPSSVKYSVIIVSTKYSRRLQAVLLALAHQRGIDPAAFEVIIAYVPGIDATDDLIESMGHAYPHLSIVRSSFSENFAHSKGFMINESVRLASGARIILMDSDIVVPPDIFERLEKAPDGTHFIAPDGRRMLTPEMTSRVLLGAVRPWNEFDRICELSPDYRYREGSGIPCGFFQCVRREVLETIPYHELDHFEASDHVFGKEVLSRFGPETRMENVAVLHLDHGGRQWYGTDKHR